MQFTAPVFAESGSSLDPNESAIIVAVLQILGNYLSVLLVDRVGRKVLLITSCYGVALTLGIFGLYSYLDKNGVDVIQYNWVPIFSFSAAVFVMSVGIVPIPFIIMTELLPPEIKDFGMTLAMVINPGIAFVLLKIFPMMLVTIQVYGIMWAFAASAVIGIVVLTFTLPETRGKNLIKT